MCLGVLAQLGSALLFHNDHEGYSQILESEPSFAGRRNSEVQRYGVSSVQLTALALETWSFPEALILPMQRLDDRSSVAGGLLRGCYEVVSRVLVADHSPVPIGLLTRGKVRDEDLPEILYAVQNQAEDLERLLVGE